MYNYAELICRSTWFLVYIRSHMISCCDEELFILNHILQKQENGVCLLQKWPTAHRPCDPTVAPVVIKLCNMCNCILQQQQSVHSRRVTATRLKELQISTWTRVVLLRGWDQRERRRWKVTSFLQAFPPRSLSTATRCTDHTAASVRFVSGIWSNGDPRRAQTQRTGP